MTKRLMMSFEMKAHHSLLDTHHSLSKGCKTSTLERNAKGRGCSYGIVICHSRNRYNMNFEDSIVGVVCGLIWQEKSFKISNHWFIVTLDTSPYVFGNHPDTEDLRYESYLLPENRWDAGKFNRVPSIHPRISRLLNYFPRLWNKLSARKN